MHHRTNETQQTTKHCSSLRPPIKEVPRTLHSPDLHPIERLLENVESQIVLAMHKCFWNVVKWDNMLQGTAQTCGAHAKSSKCLCKNDMQSSTLE